MFSIDTAYTAMYKAVLKGGSARTIHNLLLFGFLQENNTTLQNNWKLIPKDETLQPISLFIEGEKCSYHFATTLGEYLTLLLAFHPSIGVMG